MTEYELPKSIVGWITNHAKKNYWRMADWIELDDLIRDGIMIAYKCRQRYVSDEITVESAHFMSLVKTSYYNHIGELLRYSRAIETCYIGDMMRANESYADALDRVGGTTDSDADFLLLISEMPEYLRKAVLLYFDDDAVKKLRRERVMKRGRKAESFPEKLVRLCGFPKDKDFETELRAYLWEREAGIAEMVAEDRSRRMKSMVNFVESLLDSKELKNA
jgi:hypothetical protein